MLPRRPAAAAPLPVCHLRACHAVCFAAGMVKQGGATREAAAAQFWVLDAAGLITQFRPDLPDYVSEFARPVNCSTASEGDGLLDVVRKVKPTVLLGLAGEHLQAEQHSASIGCPKEFLPVLRKVWLRLVGTALLQASRL